MSAQRLVHVQDESQAADVVAAEVTDSNSDFPPQGLARLIELTKQILQQVTELTLVNDPSVAHIESLSASEGVDFYKEVERFEVQLITFMLQRTGGNQREAAKCLGLKPTTLNNKIKRYGISAL